MMGFGPITSNRIEWNAMRCDGIEWGGVGWDKVSKPIYTISLLVLAETGLAVNPIFCLQPYILSYRKSFLVCYSNTKYKSDWSCIGKKNSKNILLKYF